MNVRFGIPQDSTDPNTLGYAQKARPYDPTRDMSSTRRTMPGMQKGIPGKTPPPKTGSPSDLNFWAGGFVNFGTSNRHGIDLDHTLIGVSGGVDYRFSPSFTAGIGLGYTTAFGFEEDSQPGSQFCAATQRKVLVFGPGDESTRL